VAGESLLAGNAVRRVGADQTGHDGDPLVQFLESAGLVPQDLPAGRTVPIDDLSLRVSAPFLLSENPVAAVYI